MSRHDAGSARRSICAHAHCLPKPPDESAIQQKNACGNLLNTASVVMTERFSTAC
ncbi:hypothetical protein GGD41_005063 [Paraburkholderia bryophila]|uniref:Uncharacterized protein n=1 Tax=Paraburkholderia bryophila TaxID=420952 RepID=A0A7Y9WCD8_9BURK|nr:hypothetical protein [Paraburkholderia bryophila]